MEADNTVCPVCTLYLRPGITLKAHLASHPKQKVIEALVRLSNPDPLKQIATTSSTIQPSTSQQWSPPNIPINAQPAPIQSNHSFIYQQFMSSTAPQSNVLNVNHLGQPYVTIPTVFNPQMMCQPYVYQQQQVIMSSGHQMPTIPRILPIESAQDEPQIIEEIHDHIEEIDESEKHEPELVLIESGNEEVVEEERNESLSEDEEIVSENEEVDENEIKEDTEGLEVKDQIIQGNDVISMSQPLIINLNQNIGYEEEEPELGSPCSNASSDYIRVRRDLNKSCQTQNTSEEPEPPPPTQEQKETYYPETTSVQTDSNYITLTNTDHEAVTSNSVALEAQNVNMMDMDGMNLMLNSDFMQNQIIAPVEEFDYNNRYERPRVLMNIGEYNENREIGDESISIDSANIRADEHMPPRGELSGQESNASDIPWSRIQYHEGNSGMSTCYDLLASETWDGSDVSDNEIPPLQSRVPPTYDNDTPTVSGYSDPPIQYKCPTCNENFNCPKERRVHQTETHGKEEEAKGVKEVGAKVVGKKKVKKLVIKPKKVMVKTENNFDNVFTNKLKVEENEAERSTVILESKTQIMDVDKVEDPLITNPTVCTICEAVLPDNTALKQHQFETHNFGADERYKCTMCDEVFQCEPKYTEHLTIHPLECRLCGKYFYRRQNLQLHMKRHLGIRPYKCTVCEKSFLTKQKLDEHKNIHTGEAPIKCNLCDESFRRHSNLVQHRNRHHFNIKRKIKDYICPCGEIFHSKKKLAWHKEIHENKPKACTQCSEKFIHASSLTRHMRRAHNERFVPKEDRQTENVECPICNGIFLRSSLDVHIRNHSGVRQFRCLICNKEFTTKWNLKLHKWTHASRASKPFKCDQCKGAFIRESDYTAHMNSHKSIRPYTCNYCGAQFIRKYNCQRHVKEHEKVKTFKCQVCSKSFHRSYYLKDHMRVHSGVRPYSCHICGKTSTTKSNHNKHVRIHHAREPVSTEN